LIELFCDVRRLQMKKSLLFVVAASLLSMGVCSAANVLDDYGGKVQYAPSCDDEFRKENTVQRYNKKETAAPVRVSADKAEYNDDTGDFYASGNVVLTQNGQTIRTTYAEGNMKNGQVFLKQGGEFAEGGLRMQGDWIYYNFMSKSGEMQKVSGRNHTKNEWYSAPDARIRNGNLHAEHGATMSWCPAKKNPPCMSVEAKYFEIIPHKMMIAKDCWVKVRGKKIYHRDRWVNDLTKKHHSKISPRAGYDSDQGASIGLVFDRPLWKGANFYAEGRYFSHDNWKYWYEVNQDADDFDITYGNGWVDNDGDWYHKNSNIRFNLKPHRIAKGLPLSYSGYFERGIWRRWYRNGSQRYSPASMHTDYGVYLYHDPIHFFNSKKNYLNLYIGKTWTREEVGNSNTSSNAYGATFTQELGRDWKVWVGYYDNKYIDNRLFDINQPDMAKELRPGIQYTTPNKRDTLSLVYRHNLKDGSYNGYNYGHRYQMDLSWKHRFCCWDFEVVYERRYAKQDNRLRISYNFSFM